MKKKNSKNKNNLKGKNNFLLPGLIIAIVLIVVVFLIFGLKNDDDRSIGNKLIGNGVIGNKEILKEIDRLLLPVSVMNVTTSDFDKLKDMVKNDKEATDEVSEVILLAKHKEYAHIGHGLGYLYEYIQSGEESVCPGHSLAHYYVFWRDKEFDSARENFNDAQQDFAEWNSTISAKGSSYLSSVNYNYNVNLIVNTIKEIKTGDVSTSEATITELVNAPCVKED